VRDVFKGVKEKVNVPVNAELRLITGTTELRDPQDLNKKITDVGINKDRSTISVVFRAKGGT